MGANVAKYAEVRKDLRTARKAVLSQHGLNEDQYRDLEREALKEVQELGVETSVDTEHGVVYLSERPTFIHKHSEPFGTVVSIQWRES